MHGAFSTQKGIIYCKITTFSRIKQAELKKYFTVRLQDLKKMIKQQEYETADTLLTEVTQQTPQPRQDGQSSLHPSYDNPLV